MPKSQKSLKQSRKARNDALFRRAYNHWERGELRSAFRLFLAAAKAGDSGCQINIGYFYDRGLVTKRSRSSALYWYKRAYRHGERCAAANIGTIFRDEQKPERALYWFRRAVMLGDQDANLDIAKIYLRAERDRNEAIAHLKLVCQSNEVMEESAEEAQQLLKQTLTKRQAKRKANLAS